MIIKDMYDIKKLEDFINNNKNEKILILNKFQDFGNMKFVKETCEKVDEFLKIEIGENFFYITKTDIKSGSGCNYFLSDRKWINIVKEENYV